jgi:pimeloyl-ACP methyl ester carboxylesterase
MRGLSTPSADPDRAVSGFDVDADPLEFSGALAYAGARTRNSGAPWPRESIMASNERQVTNSVVLVHGGFVDGSGWEGVYRMLRKAGLEVGVVQHPTISLADDVAATRRVIARMDGPVILVGHSYGGAVITEAGNDPRVTGLVYVAAFAPDHGESVSSIIGSAPPGAPVPPILPPQDGRLLLDRAKFPAWFAADVESERAAFMADSQLPWGVDASTGVIREPAWKSKPSWYLVASDDRMIPPPAQRSMAKRAGATIVEVAGSHAVFASQADAVASLILRAARAEATARAASARR